MSNEREGQQPEDLGGNATQQLGGFIERIERLEEEKDALKEDLKSEYAAAAAAGIDKKALKQIIKDRKADLDKTIDLRAIVETYRRALSTLQGTLGDWARIYRSRQAKTMIDQAKQDYADPKLDEFLKGRKAKGDTKGDEAQP